MDDGIADLSSRRHFQLNLFPRSRRQRNQHIQTEFLPLAAYQVGHALLRDAEYFRGFGLCPFLVADFDAKFAHQLGAHGEDGDFLRCEN